LLAGLPVCAALEKLVVKLFPKEIMV